MTLSQFALVLSLTLAAVASGSDVGVQDSRAEITPFNRVLATIAKITKEVTDEGEDEATAYGKFACWCDANTKKMAKQAEKYTSTIGVLAADIDEYHVREANLGRDISNGKVVKMGKLSADHADFTQRLKEEQANFQNEKNKYDHNKKLIDSAIKTLQESATRVNFSFVQRPFVQMPDVAEYVREADAMGLITSPKQKVLVTSLLQGGLKGGPMESYSYHGGSTDIIDLLTDLRDQMVKIWAGPDGKGGRQADLQDAIKSNKDMIENNEKKTQRLEPQIDDLERAQSRTGSRIGQRKTSLLQRQEELEDTDMVLKEVTAVCEARAVEYDKRTQMRKDELEALTAATACLSKAKEGASNQARFFLQSTPGVTSDDVVRHNRIAVKDNGTEKPVTNKSAPTKPLSFLQGFLAKGHASSFLQRGGVSLDDRKKHALAMLSDDAKKLDSSVLKSVAALTADPFTKVKNLIEKLIVRLREESLQETTKKGFCDFEVSKAETERDARLQESKSLNTEIRGLEARLDALKKSIKDASASVKEMSESLAKLNEDSSNLIDKDSASLKEQQDAHEQIQNALRILMSFYKQAARAADSNFLQEEEDESEDAEPASKTEGEMGGEAEVAMLGTVAQAEDDKLAPAAKAESDEVEAAKAESDEAFAVVDLADGGQSVERVETMQESDEAAEADSADGGRSVVAAEKPKTRAEIEALNDNKKRRSASKVAQGTEALGNVPAAQRQGGMKVVVGLLQVLVSDFDRAIRVLKSSLAETQASTVKTATALQEQKRRAEQQRDMDSQERESTSLAISTRTEDLQTSIDLLDGSLKQLEVLKPTCMDSGMSYKERVEKREEEIAALKRTNQYLLDASKQEGKMDIAAGESER